jgi:hypothetical protein
MMWPNGKSFGGKWMLKSKLLVAGILSVGALALSVPAMAGGWGGYSDRNYNAHMACHESDGAGTISETNDVGGATGSYVVVPNGCGGYWDGELILNASLLDVNNPCVFTLETSGGTPSSYWVDPSGVVYETLVWDDETWDACSGDTFTDTVEGAMSIPNVYGVANQTKTTSNILIVVDSTPFSLAGTGECVSSAGH